ncbi:MAG: hypothetical protein II127_06710 [Ruminococcus sp.]|nr:hypothetical protein [Ruminococcus sp.]
MNNAYLSGYRKKNITQLLRAIDDCTTLSQLFALIQHEQIEVQMHAQSGASNVKPRKLTTKEILGNRDLPLDRLKMEVKKAVCGAYVPPSLSHENSELIQKIRDTKTLSELFTLIQREHIRIPMHAQTGASNLTPKKLEPKLLVDTGESPFDRFKAEVVRTLIEQGN